MPRGSLAGQTRAAGVRAGACRDTSESLGNLGDVRPIGDGLSELRIHTGPGYRIYLMQRGRTVVILLGGGDKGTQKSDIAAAKALAKELREQDDG